MRTILTMMVATLLLTANVFSGAVKKTRSEVNFKKLGRFTSVQTVKISGKKKLTDSENKFKGKGFFGKVTGKALLKSGLIGEIIDLNEMTIHKVNHKKKTYRVFPVEKISADDNEGSTGTEEGKQDTDSQSKIKIIRSEFRVTNTGESMDVNKFPTNKYTVHWLTEWVDESNGRKGTDRLLTIVRTTPITSAIKKASSEESRFNREHLKAIGLDSNAFQQEIFGTSWLTAFKSMGGGGRLTEHKYSKFKKELNKIKGYPVVIDGMYYFSRAGGEDVEKSEKKGMKKLFGKLKKKSKKTSKNGNDPAFSYYVETLEISPKDLDSVELDVPTDYRQRK